MGEPCRWRHGMDRYDVVSRWRSTSGACLSANCPGRRRRHTVQQDGDNGHTVSNSGRSCPFIGTTPTTTAAAAASGSDDDDDDSPSARCGLGARQHCQKRRGSARDQSSAHKAQRTGSIQQSNRDITFPLHPLSHIDVAAGLGGDIHVARSRANVPCK